MTLSGLLVSNGQAGFYKMPDSASSAAPVKWIGIECKNQSLALTAQRPPTPRIAQMDSVDRLSAPDMGETPMPPQATSNPGMHSLPWDWN